MTAAFVEEGLTVDEARRHLSFVDINGLVVKARTDLMPHNLPYAHDLKPMGFLEAIDAVKPHVLIGATGAPGTFTQTVIARMSAINPRPVIFALSNPTSCAECTADQAYAWSDGRAIFASGSPFAPVTLEGKTYVTGQANNSHVFPGLGLGVLATGATRVVDEMFFAAAQALADQVSADNLAAGRIFPPAARMRDVAAAVATAVARVAYAEDFASRKQPADVAAHIRESMYRASYA
jgi:malate dehydrogenase (oxaloacetate-decarboxylating)(NADP+)